MRSGGRAKSNSSVRNSDPDLVAAARREIAGADWADKVDSNGRQAGVKKQHKAAVAPSGRAVPPPRAPALRDTQLGNAADFHGGNNDSFDDDSFNDFNYDGFGHAMAGSEAPPAGLVQAEPAQE